MPMEQHIRDSGKIIKNKGKVSILMLRDKFTMDNGLMGKGKDMDYVLFKIKIHMKEIGKMINFI